MMKAMGLKCLSMPDPNAPVDGAYAGDLLSWVMGRAEAGNVWATIMTNMNVVAVASLVGTSAVVICENSEIAAETVQAAKDRNVNIFASPLPIYEFCNELSRLFEAQ